MPGFTNFRRLPPELRDMIWEHALAQKMTQPAAVRIVMEQRGTPGEHISLFSPWPTTQSVALTCMDSWKTYERGFQKLHTTITFCCKGTVTKVSITPLTVLYLGSLESAIAVLTALEDESAPALSRVAISIVTAGENIYLPNVLHDRFRGVKIPEIIIEQPVDKLWDPDFVLTEERARLYVRVCSLSPDGADESGHLPVSRERLPVLRGEPGTFYIVKGMQLDGGSEMATVRVVTFL